MHDNNKPKFQAENGNYWSSSDGSEDSLAWIKYFSLTEEFSEEDNKSFGFSVRCIKDKDLYFYLND